MAVAAGRWLILLVLLSAVESCTDTSSCFLKKLFDFSFPEEDVYNISLSNSDPPAHKILGYGDFNDDLRADYAAVDSQNNILIFYYQDSGEQEGQYLLVYTAEEFQGCAPLNTYLYDVNRDSQLDITVWGVNADGRNCMYPLMQKQTGKYVPSMQAPRQFGLTTQPIQFQTPMLIPGVKTNCFMLYDEEESNRVILYFNTNNYTAVDWRVLFLNNINEGIAFSDQHWNSFIDLTGDCYPEIVVTSVLKEIQFWVYTSNGYVLVNQVKYSSLGIQELSALNYNDVNYDGQHEIILANSSHFMVYQSNLASSNNFCQAGKTSFNYNWQRPTVIAAPENCTVSQQNIHFGDLNIDGYSDLLFNCRNEGKNKMIAYQNTFADDGGSFKIFDVYQSALDAWINSHQYDVTGASLFDILQNGIIDILVTIDGNKTIILYNNYLYQNYFYIKGLATDGSTSEQGTQVVGASFFWVNSLGNSQKTAVYSQMVQTAYGASPMPYALTGLGKANNYVEQFTLGRLGSDKSWSPIIPNSQLAVFSGSTDSNTWGIKIFIMPTDSIVYVLIVCIIILAILGIVLVILKCRSKKEENVLLQDYM